MAHYLQSDLRQCRGLATVTGFYDKSSFLSTAEFHIDEYAVFDQVNITLKRSDQFKVRFSNTVEPKNTDLTTVVQVCKIQNWSVN